MDNINNIYSFLLLTGYLKVIKDRGENQYELVIPNKEVYEILLIAKLIANTVFKLNCTHN